MPLSCRPPWFTRFDVSLGKKITTPGRINFEVKLNVLNVFDIDPEFDPSAAYALFNYNPAWAGPNMLGRYFRVGVKLDF